MAVTIPLVKPGAIWLVAVATAFGCIATVAVGLRLWAARISRRRLDASDWCALAAWVFMCGLNICCIFEAALCGFGWHYDEIVSNFGLDPITKYHKTLLAIEVLWNSSLTATKISVLLFYTKVFAVTSIRLAAKITIVFMALLGASAFLCTMLICHPFAFNWDLSIEGGSCGSQSAVFAAFGIMNLVTDVLVLAMPIKSLLGLRLEFWKKASLLATFTVGFITCVASVIRLAYLSKIVYSDVTFTSVTAVIMTAVEPSLAVILACIPLLRPLIGPNGWGQGSSRKSTVLSTWLSSKRSPNLTSSKRQSGMRSSGMTRLSSLEAELGISRTDMRSAVLSTSTRYDSDDAMELRYVLSPGENVSHHAHVEASRRRSSSLSTGDETIRQQIREVETGLGGGGGGGMAIVVKQEWNVASEPIVPPCS